MKAMKTGGNVGLRLAGLWLVAGQLLPLLGVRVPSGGLLLTILAVVAGVLLLLDR